MPFHYYNRLWGPTPDSGSWGAESMPKTLVWMDEHKPPPIPHKPAAATRAAATSPRDGDTSSPQAPEPTAAAGVGGASAALPPHAPEGVPLFRKGDMGYANFRGTVPAQ